MEDLRKQMRIILESKPNKVHLFGNDESGCIMIRVGEIISITIRP